MSLRTIDPGPRMSQAIVHGGRVYTAGQVDDSGPDVTTQTRAILAKLESLLERAGSNRSHVLSATIWLADINTFAEMNAVWEAWIDPMAPPTRATVESKLAAPQYKVEIAFIAAVADD